MEVRSNRFNYNPDYTGPRFYTFSTWADDITRFFLTSTAKNDNCVYPCSFLAFKGNYSGFSGESYTDIEMVIDYLENYFENKLSSIRKEFFADENVDASDYEQMNKKHAPLHYLLEALVACGVVESTAQSLNSITTKFIYENIYEQNYDGAFTDIICNIPHGVYVKKINPETTTDFMFANSGEVVDDITATVKLESDISERIPGTRLNGWNTDESFGGVRYDDKINFIYNVEYPSDYHTEDVLDFIIDRNTQAFDFDIIIPLYKCGIKEISMKHLDEHDVVNMTEVKPLGIWFCPAGEHVTVKTAASDDKYTASWSLSISTQIKPYYASNSVPVTYSSCSDVAVTMNSFAQVLSKVQELSASINQIRYVQQKQNPYVAETYEEQVHLTRDEYNQIKEELQKSQLLSQTVVNLNRRIQVLEGQLLANSRGEQYIETEDKP